MALNYKTPGYFRKFRCLGDECPDTCCQQWEIKLDRQHYELLQEKMSQDPHQKSLFDSYIIVNDKPVQGDYDYAHITMADNGYCPMLGGDGLCDIHRAHGVEPLGNVCAFFPRVIVRRGDSVEMSGALSCPEVARLCLGEDKLPGLTRFTPGDLPRPQYPITRELPRSEEDIYARHFARVRDMFISIMARENEPLETRLFALASMANRLSRFYHRDCEPFDDAIMDRELQRAQTQEAFASWQEFLDQYQADEPIALIVIHSILQLKLQQFPEEQTSQLASRIFKLLAANDNGERWIERFAEYQEKLDTHLGNAFERYLTRYLHNCLFREWFYTMPDSFTYIQMLLMRTAMLRFLVTGHPEVVRLIEDYESGEIDRDKLEAEFFELMVNTLYRYCRNVDQNLPFLQVLYNALSEQQMMNFDYSLPFIKY